MRNHVCWAPLVVLCLMAAGRCLGSATITVNTAPPGAQVLVAPPHSPVAYYKGTSSCTFDVTTGSRPMLFRVRVFLRGHASALRTLSLADGDNEELRVALQPVGEGRLRVSRIAFVRRGELWTMKPDGTDQRQLTRSPPIRDPVAVTAPEWSPDGRRIVCLREDHVWLADAPEDEEPVRPQCLWRRQHASDPTFTLAGNFVVFGVWDPDGVRDEGAWGVDLDDGSTRRLVPGTGYEGFVDSPRFAPDGHTLGFMISYEGSAFCFVDLLRPEQVIKPNERTDRLGWGGAGCFDWSHTSRRALVGDSGAEGVPGKGLWTAHVELTEPAKWIESLKGRTVVGVRISPDGDVAAVVLWEEKPAGAVRDEQPTYEVGLLDLATAELLWRRPMENLAFDSPEWTPDGKLIVVGTEPEGDGNPPRIYALTREKGEVKLLAEDAAHPACPPPVQ